MLLVVCQKTLPLACFGLNSFSFFFTSSHKDYKFGQLLRLSLFLLLLLLLLPSEALLAPTAASKDTRFAGKLIAINKHQSIDSIELTLHQHKPLFFSRPTIFSTILFFTNYQDTCAILNHFARSK